MKKLSLSSQINLIFIVVTVLACLLFVFVLNLAFTTAYQNQNKIQLENFFDEILIKYEVSPIDLYNGTEINSEFNDYIIFTEDHSIINNSSNFLTTRVTNNLILYWSETYLDSNPGVEFQVAFGSFGNISYLGKVIITGENSRVGVFAVSNFSAYLKAMSGNIPVVTSIAFVNILVAGYIIIWLWSSAAIKKLKRLNNSVSKMSRENYETPIKVEGGDEIAILAETIDHMREEIRINEATKKEMLQNIGHDLKTPVAVIKSYAEAIVDGISEPNEANIIIKQADILSQRIRQLVEFTKIEYLEINGNLEEIAIKDIIHQVVDHYKYLTKAKFTLNLDSSTHPLIADNFYIAIANIVDNATRYAKSEIKITLKNKKITIFNDGDKISKEFLNKVFKAYEKSDKGQFGLGMAISKTTLNKFGFKIYVVNKPKGVLFTIEPF